MKALQKLFPALMTLALLSACTQASSGGSSLAEGFDPDEAPLEERIGERLFKEGRFSQFFFAQFSGNYNEPLDGGDPILSITQTQSVPLPGPFAGQGMSCVVCHRVDENLDDERGSMRSYADFARRTPIPLRGDGRLVTPRNTPPLVNAALPRSVPMFFHYDAEFATMTDLVKATLTGRNHGWLPGEGPTALSHVAQVVRQDAGSDALAEEVAPYSYAQLLSGAADMPEIWQLPEADRLNISEASDEEILEAVAHFIAVYVNNLTFSQDEDGLFDGSPYDRFLINNDLPRAPEAGESEEAYARRLREQLNAREDWDFIVEGEDSSFEFHNQDFQFGEPELAGLKIFLAEPPSLPLSPPLAAAGGIGNCLACHAPPNFTDFKFHNTGVTQDEYDKTHGEGEFQRLFVPGLVQRNQQPAHYLPPNGDNPNGQGRFMAMPSLERLGWTDLGLWNVLGNPFFPTPQAGIKALLCEEMTQHFGELADCSDNNLLIQATARFKTPGLRDLGHGAPFMHNGEFADLSAVLRHYQDFAGRARAGQMRNAPQDFLGMALVEGDLEKLEAFLNSLNEDYD